MRKILVTITSLILVTNTAFANADYSAPNDSNLENSVKLLGSLSYMDALSGLRTMAGSPGEQTITILNDAYKELKAQGIQNPSVSQVVQ